MRMNAETQRKRIQNLNEAAAAVKSCYNKLRIRDYMPGQVIYNLDRCQEGADATPTEYDENLLKEYQKRGFELIQIHTDWMDTYRQHGADKFSAIHPEGMKKFVDMCHKYGIKIIAYASSTFFWAKDPDFKEEFARMDAYLRGGTMNLRINWSGSPEWREYVWNKSMDMLEEYGFDGLYNDMGHDAFLKNYVEELERTGFCSGETMKELPYEQEVEDFLALYYEEMKRRGMIYKVHIGNYLAPNTKEKVYDYLYVAEGSRSLEGVIENCKHMQPYLVPAFDRRVCEIKDPDTVYACCIPFVQFPLLYHGRPITHCGWSTDLEYFDSQEFDGKLLTHDAMAVKHLKEHPGEYTYSEWSEIPDDPKEFDRCSHYLALYKPMVTDGSIARMEVRNCDFITSPIPEKVYISLFTNEEQYMVVSNLTDAPYEVTLAEPWANRETGEEGTSFCVPVGKILFLKKL